MRLDPHPFGPGQIPEGARYRGRNYCLSTGIERTLSR